MNIKFPLRPDLDIFFMDLPDRPLTQDEADRLCRFIESLAVDDAAHLRGDG